MDKEKNYEKEKVVTVRFSSTNEISAKNALKMIFDTYEKDNEQLYQEYQKAQ